MRTLPPRQFSALQILAGASSLTVTVVARYMRTGSTTAKNALRDLSARGYAARDDSTWPAKWAITPEGREALAAELRQEA